METNDYENTLQGLRRTLTTELSDLAVHNPATDDWEIKTPESTEADGSLQADAAEDADARSAELEELETRYRAVNLALGKITAGTYGICEISGEAIELDRLAANPAARTNKANMERENELPL